MKLKIERKNPGEIEVTFTETSKSPRTLKLSDGEATGLIGLMQTALKSKSFSFEFSKDD